MQKGGGKSDALRQAAVRLGGLRSAWAALAPCTAPELADSIATEERAAKRRLLDLAKRPGGPDAEGLRALGSAFEQIAVSLRRLAFEVEVPTLYAALPASLPDNRQGLLELLDLVANEAFDDCLEQASKLGVVDTVVTLLCTGGDPQRCVAPHDPAILTPAFRVLCERAAAECRASLAAAEAEFFSAANLSPDLADPAALRELGARKAKLGKSYFAPGMLRAIVTYNMALLQSLPPENWGADWPGTQGPRLGTAAPPAPDSTASLFESEVLRDLLAALVTRLDGGAAQVDPTHRCAWAFDLDDLRPVEVAALREGSLERQNLQVAILLIGLLCRAREVIAIELQELGIDPDAMTARWAEELDDLVRGQVNASISRAGSDPRAYERACDLSRLSNRLIQDRVKPRRSGAASRAAGEDFEERKVQREARSLANEAMAEGNGGRRTRGLGWPEIPWRRLAAPAVGLAAVVVAAVVWFAPAGSFDPNVERWSQGELSWISEHLVEGRRDGAGSGPGFVGTLADEWLALSPDDREQSAQTLVSRLRGRGVSQVMVYDTDEVLRIQSLGESVVVHAP